MEVEVVKVKRGELGSWLPWPAADANKYTRGYLAVVGGAAAYPGAVCLAATAALRLGAGYVEVLCSPEALPLVHAASPVLVARSWCGWDVTQSRLGEPRDSAHPRACLVGPGFDAHVHDQYALVFDLMATCTCPLVIDGGALSALATEEGKAIARRRFADGRALLITPHLGEAERLAKPCGISLAPASERTCKASAEFARDLAFAYGATVVLKGPDTFVAQAPFEELDERTEVPGEAPAPAGTATVPTPPEPAEGSSAPTCSCAPLPVACITRGTPALAKAGTGDVLAGMTAALVAQGLDPWKAANLAVNLHAQAGRIAAKTYTEIGVCAHDLIEALPASIAHFKS